MARKRKNYVGEIDLRLFNSSVEVFRTQKARVGAFKRRKISTDPVAAFASAHVDRTDEGVTYFSMVIPQSSTIGTKAHECSHIADMLFMVSEIPTDMNSTELRAYLMGYLMDGLEEIGA